jgi:poly(3-hydroxybutyrate) depolymerase
MTNWMPARIFLAIAIAALCASGCSVYMEETRPEPTQLDQFQTGENRDAVLDKLGPPVTTADNNGASCDLYQLYLGGYGQGGKLPIALAETAADVFTVGLAEIVSTPTEEMTKNKKSPVWFCYKKDALSSVIPGHLENQTTTTAAGPGSASAAQSASSSGSGAPAQPATAQAASTTPPAAANLTPASAVKPVAASPPPTASASETE